MATKKMQDEIKHYLGILAEDFGAKLSTVTEAVQTVRDELSHKMDEHYQELKGDIHLLQVTVRKNSEGIRKNSEDIQQNSADIRQNTADIQQNSADIRANTGAIQALSAVVTSHTTDIRQLKAEVQEVRTELRGGGPLH